VVVTHCLNPRPSAVEDDASTGDSLDVASQASPRRQGAFACRIANHALDTTFQETIAAWRAGELDLALASAMVDLAPRAERGGAINPDTAVD
jgi:hypothetical protein